MSPAITAAQIRMIHALARETGLDADTLYTIAHSVSGKESLRALTRSQAARLIDRLQVLAGKAKDIPDRASQAQQNYIHALAREMGWAEDPKRLRRFLETRAGVSDVRFLSIRAAGQVIEALKAIRDGGRAERRKDEEESSQ